MDLIANQTKYGQIKSVSFTVDEWLQKNDTEIYSTYKEGKSVLAEKFIRTLKTKIYKYLKKCYQKMCVLTNQIYIVD